MLGDAMKWVELMRTSKREKFKEQETMYEAAYGCIRSKDSLQE